MSSPTSILATSTSVRRPLPWLGAVALAAVVLVALPANAGEIYQWKDAQGVTHYSDSPPPNREYKNRTITNSGAATVATAQKVAPAENEQCTTARNNLKQLQGEAPVGIDADKDGKPDTVMNPEQRASQTELAQAALKVHCTESDEVGAAAS